MKKFIRENIDHQPIVDNVFKIVNLANDAIAKKGKENIEEAIRKEPNNTELRFIRLSVQKNAPSFLGYKSNVQEDTDFIKKRLREFDSEILDLTLSLLKFHSN